jgi:hypothetical protein
MLVPPEAISVAREPSEQVVMLSLGPAVLINPFQSDGGFFDSQDQFFSDIHLTSRIEADTDVGDGFTNDAARHGHV